MKKLRIRKVKNQNNSHQSNKSKKFIKPFREWNLIALARTFALFAILISLATSWVWYNRIYMSPERRFWNAINNSMTTSSVVRTIEYGGSGNKAVQDFRFHFAPQRVIENKVMIEEKSATASNVVVTEGIVYPNEQFNRYLQFENTRNGVKDADISELLGKWAIQQSTDSEENNNLNFLSEYITLAIFGNFPADFRREVINNLKRSDAYGTDLSTPKQVTGEDGEEHLEYVVTVKLPEYVAALNSSFVKAGYGEFPALSQDNYRAGSTTNGLIKINKNTGMISGITFGQRVEAYSNYGVMKIVEKPATDLTLDALQNQVEATINKEVQQ